MQLRRFCSPAGLNGVVAAAVSWGTATVLVHQLPNPVGLVPAVALLAVAMGAWWIFGWRWLVWFAAGALWTTFHIHARLAERLPTELQGGDFAITGWVDGFPNHSPGQVSFSFRVVSGEPADAIPGRLRLSWYDPPPDTVQPGSAFDLVVRLKPPRGLINPGGFDYERWLFQEGYGATGYVREGRAASAGIDGMGRQWLILRARLAGRIGAAAPTPDAAALLTALTIGERFRFQEPHWRTLRRTGTSHLVAISGLHVGLVAGLVFFICRRVVLRLPIAAASRDLELAAMASLLAAAVYAGLAGFTVPTQRALIMLAVAHLAIAGRRSVDMSSGLSTAALLVLAWDPIAPLSASFWLSFVAVALLWQLARSENHRSAGRSALRPATSIIRVQWGISLGLIPVVALFFNDVSLISPVVNILAIPLFSVVLVPLSLAAVAVASLHPVGEWLILVAGTLLQWTWNGLAAIAEFPWAAVTLVVPPGWVMAMSALGAAAALAAFPLPARNLAWLTLIPVFFWEPARPREGGAVVEVLDVGHGLAILVETRTHTLLYDAGALYRSGFDTGREIVLPAMRAKSLGTLDVLVVSHADNDHAGGAAAVYAAFPEARVIMGPDVSLPGGAVCEAGATWTWDRVDFRVLHPQPTFRHLGNDSSCVLKIATAAGSVLFTGDVEAAGERALMADAAALAADVVVVPHHGSATSSSLALVAAAAPEYAVVSASYLNHWGFPKPGIVERWRDAGATILSTGEVGAIRISLEPDEAVRVQGRRSLRRRYWNAGHTSDIPGSLLD